MLPTYALLQVLAVVLAYVLLRGDAFDYRLGLSVILSITFSHYLMALWYARRRFTVIAKQPVSLVALGSVGAVGFGLYMAGFPLFAYFGLHHAFNETYLRNARLPNDPDHSTVMLRTAAIILHFTAVLLLLQNPIRYHYESYLWGVLLVATIFWVRALAVHWPRLTAAQRIDQVMFEVIVLVLLVVTRNHPITLYQLVAYHVIFWGFYPLLQLVGQSQQRPLLVYLLLTILTIGGFLAISPSGFPAVQVSPAIFYSQFIVWSWIHITLAFATSSAHPKWITRWFAPRKAVSV